MPTFRSVQEVDAWRVARELVREVYRITSNGPLAQDFGFRDQIRRASVSIVSNIAEGFERDGRGEFVQFLAVAKGSAGEVKSQLILAYDLGYIDRRSFEECDLQVTRNGQMIGGLMNYLKNTQIQGLKYRSIHTEKRETRNAKRGLR